MFVLIGDSHIPGRAKEIPKRLLRKAAELKPEMVLWTGDFTARDVMDKVGQIGKIRACKGNMDFLDLPYYHRIDSNGRRILLIHGDTIKPRGEKSSLIKLGKKYGCSVVVCGHTHRPEVFEEDGILVINPGSCTGAWSGGGMKPAPSFAGLDFETHEVTLYKLVGSEIEEEVIKIS